MATTDQRLTAAHERGTDDTDETDEEQRQISSGGSSAIPPKGGLKAIFIRFFISGISVIRGCSPLF